LACSSSSRISAPAPLADHEAVAVRIERTRSVLGIVVARRKRLHGVETAHGRFVDRSFRTAGDHHVGLAVADGVERGDQAVVRRGAGRNRTIVRAHEAVLHRDEAGRDVGNHAGDEEGAKPRGLAALVIAHALIEERLESSDARAPDHTRLLLVERLHVEGCVLHGLGGRDERILGEQIVLADLLAVEIPARVVILHFTSELRLKLFGIEMSNRRCTADSLLQIRKILCCVIAERVDRTDARNDYSSFCHKFKALRP